MKRVLFICLLSIVFVFSTNKSNNNNLISLFIVHRHGNRAPIKFYEENPYGNLNYWPNGLKELTEKGKQRMFDIGIFLRQNYKEFLTENIHEVYAQSMDRKRCIESIQLLLNGLYRPSNGFNWTNSINIQINDKRYDSMLYAFSQCPTRTKEDVKLHNYGIKTFLFNNYQSLPNFLKDERVINQIELMEENLICMAAENLNLLEVSLEDIDELKKLYSDHLKMFVLTKKLQRLRTGVFLNEFSSRIEDLINNKKLTKETKKLHVYSADDRFMTNLMYTLNLNAGFIEFGSTLIFELYQIDEIYSIKILYLNRTDNHLFELKIPNCLETEYCTIEQFESSYSQLIITPEKWIEECGISSITILHIFIVSILIFLAILPLLIRVQSLFQSSKRLYLS